MIDLPHFALPFRYANGEAVAVEQDSTDEIVACELAILLCPRGFRVELPEFGIPDPTFTEGAPNASVIAAALGEWEPRAQELVTSYIDELDELAARIRVEVGTPSDD